MKRLMLAALLVACDKKSPDPAPQTQPQANEEAILVTVEKLH